MNDDAYASPGTRNHTEFQDKHGHSEIVSFRALPAVVAQMKLIKEKSQDFFSASDVFRACLYEGLKVIEDRIDDPNYVPNPDVAHAIEMAALQDGIAARNSVVEGMRKMYFNTSTSEDRQVIVDLIRRTAADTKSVWVRQQLSELI